MPGAAPTGYQNIVAIAQQLSTWDIFVAHVGELSIEIDVEKAALTATTTDDDLKFELIMMDDSSGQIGSSYCQATLTGTGFKVNTDKCVDSDGNPIPRKVGDIQTSYAFQSLVNLSNMRTRLSMLGQNVTTVGTVTTEGGSITCDAQGNCTEESL